MKLLWVFVFVGMFVGVAKVEGVRVEILDGTSKFPFKIKTAEESRTSEEKAEACEQEKDEGLCIKGFFFTATALQGVRDGGEVEVLLALEKSLHPHVTFDLSLRSLGDRNPWDDSSETDEILAMEEVTVKVNELRRVVLRVIDLPWTTANLYVTPRHTGIYRRERPTVLTIKKVSSETEVFFQTAKSEYAHGDTVDYRAVVVDGNVDKTPKFAQIFMKGVGYGKWVEVPQSGIVRGNFTYDAYKRLDVRVTSDVTSNDTSTATIRRFRISDSKTDSHPPQQMSVSFEGLSDVSFSQPRLQGRVKLTSTDGFPLKAKCNVTFVHDGLAETRIGSRAKTRVAVKLVEGEFDLDVVEELGAKWDGAKEEVELTLEAKCRHLQSGSVVEANETIRLWKSLFRVDLVTVESSTLNSSHPQSTVVLQFLVERRDGGSVEEEEPSKGLHVKLLLSEERLQRLLPSATEFSAPIPPNGRVRLEFQVKDTPAFSWEDRIRMEVGDAKEEETIHGTSYLLSRDIHVTPVDPARLVRRGDVVRFRLRSCLPYSHVNAILKNISSHKAIFSYQRFSFSPEGEELDEVIDLTIPQNVTEGSLRLLVYGIQHPPSVFDTFTRKSIKVNVVSSSGPQVIKIVDQVNVDMSTIVTFRLEGMLADSVVSLQAAKLESPEEVADDREGIYRLLKCHYEGYLSKRETPEVKYRDDSPDAIDPFNVAISANVEVEFESYSNPHPQLSFLDVDTKTATEDNGTLTVTKTFDRLTEFGRYVVSGATFHSKSGRTVFSNSPVLKIHPPPVTLSLSLDPSVRLGETVEVFGYVRNNQATPFEGHVTLHSREGGSTEVTQKFTKVKPNAFKILKMNVTPQKTGDLFVSLSSNISSRLTATKRVSVIPIN